MMRTSRTSDIQSHARRTRPGQRSRCRPQKPGGGFTLLEVMLALSILAVALVGLIGRTTSNIRISEEVAMQGVVTELVRGKMYDIEEELLRDGFQELDQSSEGEFDEEGWPAIRWEAKVEKIELPNLGSLESMGQDEGQTGEGGEAGAGGMLGGLLSMGGMGGMGGGSEDGAGDMSMEFISSQYEILREVMEQAIRKVTLTATWKVGLEEKEMVVACYFTDPAAIGRVLPGAGGIGGGVGGGTGGGVGGGGSGGRTGGVVGGGGSGRGGDQK